MIGDRARGRAMLIRLLAERIVAEHLAEQEMLARAQPGDNSIEPDQASDARASHQSMYRSSSHDDGHA